MPASKPTTVDEYLRALPEDRRALVAQLRDLARRHLRSFREGIEFGMPYYRRSPVDAVGFANRAGYIAVYLGKATLAQVRDRVTDLDVGEGCLRFRPPGKIDFVLVEELFRLAAR